MMRGGSARSTPFLMAATDFRSKCDGRGRAIRHPIGGEETWVFITAGQSNIANWSGASYAPSNGSKIDNLNFFDGGIYAAADPVLGSDGDEGYWPMRLADKMIAAGTCGRVILVPVAVGASAITEWAPGGAHHQRLSIAFARCAALALPVKGVLWQQGEAETNTGATQQFWEDGFNAMVSAQLALGNDAPWFVGISSYSHGVTSAAVQAAQAAVVDNEVTFQGGNSDTITSATYRVSNHHFNATGANANADLWKAALEAVL
jgi:hypothetical protein